MSRLDHACGNGRATFAERRHDLYETPTCAVTSLLKHVEIPARVWEPACGPGQIVRELRRHGRQVYGTDLVDYVSQDQDEHGRDFLFEHAAPDGCKCIVTNPPFKLAAEFVAHSRRLVPRTIMLLRLAFLESDRRRAILDGGDLAAVYVYRKRLPMMHRAEWEGRKANSGMAFAWFVWDHSHRGPTTIHRISWEAV